MRFKHRAWIPAAWLLSAGNVVAVWFAAAPGEPTHATAHAVGAVLFALGARHLQTRQPQQQLDDGRLARLQEGIDVIAIEVERISEGQRYLTKILHEEPPPSVGRDDKQAIPIDRTSR